MANLIRSGTNGEGTTIGPRARATASRTEIDKLTRAAETGNIEEIHDILVRHRLDDYFTEESDSRGFTPITATLLRSSQPTEIQLNVLEELRSFGADFHIPDANGMLPLFASLSGETDLVLYVSRYADLEQRMPGGINFLMAAASLGLIDIVSFFANDFNLNQQDENGNTALHHAIFAYINQATRIARSPAVEIVRELCQLDPKPDTSIENNAGQTAFQLALEREMYDVGLELFHCDLPEEGFRQIGVQIGGQTIHYEFHIQDSVAQIKQAIFGTAHRNFNLIFPRFRRPNGANTPHTMKIMDDERELRDYNLQNGDILVVQAKIRSGFGGKRRHRTRKQKHKQKKN